ncbi:MULTISPECIES: hypothetical protein [unclassified Cryobacterium]|uniref:hypothetical protein n=1 Tax=unclassified Cryobacterium TaxID=2649013 RepID=UPI002B222C9F|nr:MULTISPECIES: hypothetical protein [Cryobacterium]MEB0303862.1 hypothetical protein [Cryobacterium sp. 10I1]MEC5148750.1 hypothetical protein [Cryobacterium psychrotolerans]
MNQLTSADSPGIYTATGDGTVGIIEIGADGHTVIAWLLHEVADDDDSYPEDERPGGPINDLNLTIGEPGILHGAGTIGDAELGVIVTITKLSPRVA